MRAVSNQGVDVSVCDAEVRAMVVGAGETLGSYPFRSPSSAFDLAPGAHRKRGWSHTRREGGGETAGRTSKWSARLEETVDFGVDGSSSRVRRAMLEPGQLPKPRQAEYEEEQAYMKGHRALPCLK